MRSLLSANLSALALSAGTVALNLTVREICNASSNVCTDSNASDNSLSSAVQNTIGLVLRGYAPKLPQLFNCLGGSQVAQHAVNEKLSSACATELPNVLCKPALPGKAVWNRTAAVAGVNSFFALWLVLLCALALMQYRRSEHGDAIDKLGSPLVLDPSLGAAVRFLMPLALLMNASVFVSTNTSAGASVVLYFESGDDVSFSLPPLYTFTLASSLRQMWGAHVYPLAVMIAVFSGAGAYLKLAAMLVVWLAPVRLLGLAARERWLHVIIFLAKWSLVDTYVLIMMKVAFYFDVGYGASAMQVVLRPEWGFYGFVLGSLATLALAHIMLVLHVRTVRARHGNGETAPLLVQAETAVRGEADEPLYRRACLAWPLVWRTAGMAVLLLTSGALTIVGALHLSCAFEFRGGAAIVLHTLGRPSTRSFSLLSLGRAVRFAGRDADSPGVVLIELLFLLFGFGVPLLALVLMAVLWFAPLGVVAQQRLCLAVEVVNSWAALDVFVASLVACLSQLHEYARFIVGSHCALIDVLFRQFFATQLAGDDTCFDVRALLLPGCWMLFVACALYTTSALVVLRAASSAARRAA